MLMKGMEKSRGETVVLSTNLKDRADDSMDFDGNEEGGEETKGDCDMFSEDGTDTTVEDEDEEITCFSF